MNRMPTTTKTKPVRIYHATGLGQVAKGEGEIGPVRAGSDRDASGATGYQQDTQNPNPTFRCRRSIGIAASSNETQDQRPRERQVVIAFSQSLA